MPPSSSRFPVRVVLFALALCALLPACSSGGGGGGDGGGGDRLPPDVELLAAFGGLTFSRPVKLVQHPSDATRWYVVEQGGKIRTFLSTNPAGTLTTALDLVEDFDVDLGNTNGEQGLLGMAFDPSFATTGAIYISYTDEDADDSILARYASLDGGLTIVPSADPILLAIPHPAENHNAGDLAFGSDGFLYYGTGDGGGSDDPDDNGQDRNVLLGKVLRLDVRSAPPMGRRYAIPPTNPFSPNAFCDTGSGTQPCPEIFAWGFRNPWRMNFDPTTNDLWLGDVGQGAREEIDRVLGGRNYGWDCFEGDLPHATAASCGGAFEDPVAVHDRTDARAITGGAVYRGSVVPDLRGFYVYADFVTGRFFAFDVGDSAPEPTMLSLPTQNVSAFGQDRNGEVYVVTFGTPSIYTLVPATP